MSVGACDALRTGSAPCNCADVQRCPTCNYSAHDAMVQLDHHLCEGEIPGWSTPETEIDKCERETGHAQVPGTHFCRCTHAMYDGEYGDEEEEQPRGEFLPPTQEQTIAYLEDEVQRTRAGVREREDAAIAQGFADCEALVSAGLLALAEKEDERERLETVMPVKLAHKARAACLREMSLAVSVGQFRTAECNEKAIVAAHREAAGFNSSKAGGEARMKALSPAKRKKIATKAARAAFGGPPSAETSVGPTVRTYYIVRVNGYARATYAAETLQDAIDLAFPTDDARLEVSEVQAPDARAARLMNPPMGWAGPFSVTELEARMREARSW